MKLWDRGTPLDKHIEVFTVGRDPQLDLHLLPYDALASAAHATMLAAIGVIDEEELPALLRELRVIASEGRCRVFVIETSDEDCHTAIENRLTERLGDLGRRIHTGRSRNDQVIAALRLFGREALLEVVAQVLAVSGRLLALADEHRAVSVAGYTHTRQAMPSTLGHLFAAHAELLLDDIPWLQQAWAHINRSPLGSASGYGVSLPLDRAMVARWLGFEGVQANTLAVQNDRGKTEFLVLSTCLAVALDLGRLASDLIWFSSEALGYVSLSDDVTTGSSIMPQKRNPDVLELIRGQCARLRGLQAQIAAIYGPLASGYQRDLQLCKGPFIDGLRTTVDLLLAVQPVLRGLTVDVERCATGMNKAIGATDAVYASVARGEPFRTAYKRVAADPEGAVEGAPQEAWRQRTHTGAPGNVELEPSHARRKAAAGWLERRRTELEQVWQQLEKRADDGAGSGDGA